MITSKKIGTLPAMPTLHLKNRKFTGTLDAVGGIATSPPLDMVASKLLANSDRSGDGSDCISAASYSGLSVFWIFMDYLDQTMKEMLWLIMVKYFLLSHFLFAVGIATISAIMTRLVLRHLSINDVPNERSSHTHVTPKGGGIAIVTAYMTGILIFHTFGDITPMYTSYSLGYFAASCAIAALSFLDDLRPLSFTVKLGGYAAAIIVAMLAGIVIDVTYLPLLGEVRWGWGTYPLTLMWVLGLTNSFNFMDGLDGLAASTAGIAALFLAIISFQQGSNFIYLASLVLAAASFGFLIFNWPPAKIFMGDIGSTFLGFTFATMAVIAARYDDSHTSFFVVPLLLFHFIFDTLFTFFRRLSAGENVFLAHRSHLYQLLNRLRYSHKKVALLYSAMAISQGIAAVWMANDPVSNRMVIFLPFLIFYIIYAGWVLHQSKKEGII